MRSLRDDVLGACLSGAEAIETIASRMSDDDWFAPTPCHEWDAADLLDHAFCIAEDYNRFLDCVMDGRTGPLLVHEDLATHNAERMAGLRPAAPLVRLAEFGLAARRFVTRLPEAWERPLFRMEGRQWRVGDYAGFCALEWHVHAWDLFTSAGVTYRPYCRATLATVCGDWLPGLVRVGEDPWDALLQASGRHPDVGVWRQAS
ncbi:maleylpyruvate isomerase N-terminal domain-containing protein [Sphaerisporangium sp. TRM90804]|uniref:maleylpyruvate isomerase N-terminal domain-containing protein n=1 Tax=Sphaerisporangium sp. TRM90804 TaxID=3031113 RepID=UPI00244B7A9D|nr:maleylpyruvate isomerase N-terminal domain-containing protein [Sphaerisporangium sp. TRM90804]MDH2429190.1 maleylpyruvate isomerase N-terminal domain-containing protein [Sphaerisporangium sp. TRM90804]